MIQHAESCFSFSWFDKLSNRALLFIFLCFVMAVLLFLNADRVMPKNAAFTQVRYQRSTKQVLIWARTWYDKSVALLLKQNTTYFSDCPETRCSMTDDRTQLTQVDAVLYVMTDLKNHDLPNRTLRQSSQYHIFHLEESPQTAQEIWNVGSWYLGPHYFNLTFTYRTDSDLFSSNYLDVYEPHLIDTKSRNSTWYIGKKNILWMASHCSTANGRLNYVTKLQTFMKVDIIGRCGGNTVEKCTRYTADCTNLLISEYKFYLAFENSMCKEYVTEKLMNALNNDVVPIVMGAARYDILLPPKAVIDVEKYSSVKVLADYLKYLILNQTAYEEHLAWKYSDRNIWMLQAAPLPVFNARTKSTNIGFCQLCKLLHLPTHQRLLKSYSNIHDWMFSGQCRKPFSGVAFDSNLYNATMYTENLSDLTNLTKITCGNANVM